MSARPNVRAATACKIVGLHPAQLNTGVANGNYRCAPQTTPGSVRVFDEVAMLPLYFFARLLDCGIAAPWAGSVACDLAEQVAAWEAKGDPVDNIVVMIGERNPVAFAGTHPTLVKWMPESEYDRDHKGKDLYYEDDIGFEVMRFTFKVKKVREIIADMMQHELQQFLSGKSGSLL